jgi:phosphonate transport system substrate-binding protein
MRMAIIRWLFGLVVLAMTSVALGGSSPTPLYMGVLPFLSVRTLIQEFSPLQRYLEQELHRPVRIVTAPDFDSFIANTERGDYDFVVTAPHFALLAERTAGFRRLVESRARLYALIVVGKDASPRTVADLRGGVINLPPKSAIVSMLAEQYLVDHGLIPGENITVRYHRSHNSAVLAAFVDKGEAAAVGPKILEILPEDVRAGLREIGKTASTPNLILMAHPRVQAKDLAALRTALLAFHLSPLSKEFFVEESHLPFQPVTDDDMKSLEPFLELLKERSDP